MKRTEQYCRLLLTVIFVMGPGFILAQEKEAFAGSWEGMFMNDFRTLIQLKFDEDQNYTGRILMYDGELQIQDDEIFKIIIQDNKLSFYIMAKETHFTGELDPSNGKLKGIFIFPDNSEHPLTVIKQAKN